MNQEHHTGQAIVNQLRVDELARQLKQGVGIQQVEHHASIGSTNDRGLDLARQLSSAQLPLLIVADEQHSGRGRGANRWWSNRGALLFTLVLEPAAAWIAAQPRLSLTVGLGVALALERYTPGQQVQLKWPNDVYLDQRKICGILVEQPATRPVRWVVGVGINVNNSLVEAPAELQQRATTLLDATGRYHDRQEVLERVLSALFEQLTFMADAGNAIAARWRSLCLLTGKWVELDVYGSRVAGYCEGIDDDGGLLLRTPSGPQRFVGGVVVGFEAG